MTTDPRLACVELLTMAAMVAKKRQTTAPPRHVTLQIVYYDARGIEADELGERFTYELPPASGERP